jgi:hypothetical protein
MPKQISAERIPHSWSLEDWPGNVYPCRASKARYIVRIHRNELVAAGALTRIGRDLVVLGAGYSAWLAKQSARASADFEIAPNRPAATAA